MNQWWPSSMAHIYASLDLNELSHLSWQMSGTLPWNKTSELENKTSVEHYLSISYVGVTNELLTHYFLSGIYISHHYSDVIITTMASQITSFTIIYSIVYSDADQRKHQSSASLTFVRGIHRWPVNSPHKGPVPRTMFPFDDVIMYAFINSL